MQVKELKQDGLSYEMEITIPAKDIDTRTDKRLKELAKDIKMPGFRPGKVPLNIARQKYGKVILGEVLELAVNETSAKILEDKDLKPAMQPKIEVKGEFDEGTDLTYVMSVEVLPKVKIKDFKGLKLEKKVAKPDAKSVDEALERLAASRNETAPVERASKDGDTVVIDFDGRTADDDVHHPGMKSEKHQLKLGSGMFIPGFEDQLIGKKAGDKAEVKVSFPEQYGAKELAGRDAIFDVVVHEVREAAPAKIDDEFAKSFGMDSVDALKKAVEEQIQHEFNGYTRMHLKKDLMDYLDDNHKFEIPQGMMDLEYNNIVDQIKLDHQRSNPGSEAELSKDELAELKDIAERRVRLGLVLSEIGSQNNLSVPDTELQKAVISEAQKYPGQEKEVFDYYAKNRNALESLRAPMFEEKVVDYILELAEVSEKEVSIEELTAEEEEDEKPKKKAPAKKAASSKAKSDDTPKKTAAKKSASKKAPAKKKAS